MKKYLPLFIAVIFFSTSNHASGALIDNLVSFWGMDETSAGGSAVTRMDSTASNNDLTDVNTVPSGSGLVNNGADLERSSSEHLSITDGSQTGLDITGDLSIVLWVKFESFDTTESQNYDPLVSKFIASGGQRAYLFRVTGTGSNLNFMKSRDGSNSAGELENTQVSWSPSTGVFYHVAMSYNNSTKTVKFFVNGSQIGTDQTFTNADIFNSTAPLYIGRQESDGVYLDGIIDEVGIWNRALSGAEIAEIYNSGSGLAYPFTLPTPPLIGSGTINVLAKFLTATSVGDSLISDDGSNATVNGGLIANFLKVVANGLGLDTLTSGVLSIGSTTASSVKIGRSGITTTIFGSLTAGTSTVSSLTASSLNTTSNCSSSSSPASCGSAPAGSVVLAAGGSTLTVNTTAVTANSQILVTEDSSLGSRLGVTCNTTTGRVYSVTARTAGTSFTITSDKQVNSNGACLSYWIIN